MAHDYRRNKYGNNLCVVCGAYEDNTEGRDCRTIRQQCPEWRDTYVPAAWRTPDENRYGIRPVEEPLLRPCFTCGTPTEDEVCDRCKPADDYTADDLIQAKRKFPWDPLLRNEYLRMCVALRKAAACVPDDQPDPVRDWHARAAEKAKRNQPKEQWFWFGKTIPCTNEGSEGVARAVERLNQPHGSFIEGAAQWHP